MCEGTLISKFDKTKIFMNRMLSLTCVVIILMGGGIIVTDY